MVSLLETTILTLGLAYVGFDLYFFIATFAWTRRLRQVNRDALVFSGFRDVLSFVFQGPVAGVVENLTEPTTTTERAGRLVAEAYPQVRDRLGDTHERLELPQRLVQLTRDAITLRWVSVALAVGVSFLVVFSNVVPFGLEVLLAVILGNSVFMIPFASTRAEVEISLRQSEDFLARARSMAEVGKRAPGAAASATFNRR